MAHEVTIYVNSKKKSAAHDKLCYADLVGLAGYPVPVPAGALYDITYRRGKSDQEGILVDGGKCVQPHEGMEFSVDPSNRS